jgi:hypothetical protein
MPDTGGTSGVPTEEHTQPTSNRKAARKRLMNRLKGFISILFVTNAT